MSQYQLYNVWYPSVLTIEGPVRKSACNDYVPKVKSELGQGVPVLIALEGTAIINPTQPPTSKKNYPENLPKFSNNQKKFHDVKFNSVKKKYMVSA